MERNTNRVMEAASLKKKAAGFVVDMAIEGNDKGVEYDQWSDIFFSCEILLKEYQRPRNEI